MRKFQVVDITTGTELGAGEVGELCTRSEMNMIGYLNKPEVTKQALEEDGWFHTGIMVKSKIMRQLKNIACREFILL